MNEKKTTENNIFQEKNADKKYIIILSIFTFLLLFFVSKMSPLYPINEWTDVNVYFNVGKSMMEGKTLYTEAFDHKGPLIFVIYGFGYLISHSSFLGVFIIQLIGWIILINTIFLTGKLYLKTKYAFLIAIIAPLFLIKYTFTGGSAEEFILIFSAVSLYLFYLFFKDKSPSVHSPKHMLVHGILFSMAIFIKLNLAIFWVFPLIGIFICILMHRQYKNLLYNLLAFIGGMLIIALPICLYLYIHDAVSESVEVYIFLNMKYNAALSPMDTVLATILRAYNLLRADVLGTIIILIGAFYFPFKQLKSKVGAVSLVFAAISLFLVLFTPRNFHFYYPLSFYLFIIPGLISICLLAVEFVNVEVSKKLLCLLAIIALLIGMSKKDFFGLGAYELLRKAEVETPNFHFAKKINKEENPTLLNLGFGYGNSVFTLCNIKPNVKYFLTPNLSYDMYPKMRDEQVSYIEDKKVDFIILDNLSLNYEYFTTLPIFKENYSLVDTFVNNKVVMGNDFSTYYLYKKK